MNDQFEDYEAFKERFANDWSRELWPRLRGDRLYMQMKYA